MSPTSYQAAPPRRGILAHPGSSVKPLSPMGISRIQGSMIGRTLSRYRIVERLGEGGMGEVYRAHDERLDRDVALKIMAPGRGDAQDRERIQREALTLSQLSHP